MQPTSNDLSIVVPNVDLALDQTVSDKQLSALEIIQDTSIAGQVCCEPLAIGLGCLGGAGCFLLACLAQAEDNSKPATRHDVVYAQEIRSLDKKEREAAGGCGVITGASLPRLAGRLLGGTLGLFRAPVLLLQGKGKASDNVCGLKREDINNAPAIFSGYDFS